MATGDKNLSAHCSSGEVVGTGASISIVAGFKPKAVVIKNITGEAMLFWNDTMPTASGYKVNGLASGTVGNEAAHTHVVTLDTGVSAATSGGTPAGTNGTSGVTGTGTFVGTSAGSLNLATPAFSGTGLTAAGQVMTTTDNQTMGLNECAGMWLLAATAATPPMLIVSNTAVSGAPAVLTVIGAAATDAGAYKVVKNILPTGSVTALSGTAAAQTFTGDVLATHTHGPGTLGDAASGAGSTHTHTFTGAAGDSAYISSLGITPSFNGFTIGADTDVNVGAETMYWTTWK